MWNSIRDGGGEGKGEANNEHKGTRGKGPVEQRFTLEAGWSRPDNRQRCEQRCWPERRTEWALRSVGSMRWLNRTTSWHPRILWQAKKIPAISLFQRPLHRAPWRVWESAGEGLTRKELRGRMNPRPASSYSLGPPRLRWLLKTRSSSPCWRTQATFRAARSTPTGSKNVAIPGAITFACSWIFAHSRRMTRKAARLRLN